MPAPTLVRLLQDAEGELVRAADNVPASLREATGFNGAIGYDREQAREALGPDSVVRVSDDNGTPIAADFDFRQTGTQTWDIVVETDAGTLKLSQGGAVLTLPSGTEHNEDLEYPGLYSRFANLIRGGRSDVDIDPFRLVADAFLRGHRQIVEPFHD